MHDPKYRFEYIQSCNLCNNQNYKILGKRMNQSQGFNPAKKTGITTTIVKCKKCGLIYSNPCPVPEKLSDHYGIPAEDYWKPEYFDYSESYFKREIEWLKKIRPITQGMKALDIGAGIGKAMISLEKVGFDTYGIEPSEPFYQKAIDKMGISKSKLRVSSIEDAEFEDEQFDFITFGAVLEHLYDPGASIEKALKWLKKDGIIQIEVPSSDWLINKLINFIYRIKGLDYVGNISPMHEPFHLYEFSLKSFEEHAKLNNYKVVDHGYQVCTTFMPRFLDPLFRWYMNKTSTGMQLTVWLSK